MNEINVIVHRFFLGDVEDPVLYAGEPLYQWEHSEAGKWIKDHAIETPIWNMFVNHECFGHEFVISAKLREQDYTFWKLKYG